MMDSRLKPNTTVPAGSAQVPGSSGPRWRIRRDARAMASAAPAVALAEPEKPEASPPAAALTKASSPHIATSMPQPDGVGAAAGRGRAGDVGTPAALRYAAWSTLRSI